MVSLCESSCGWGGGGVVCVCVREKSMRVCVRSWGGWLAVGDSVLLLSRLAPLESSVYLCLSVSVRRCLCMCVA